MRRVTILLSVLLLIGHALTELSPFLSKYWYKDLMQRANLFLKPGFVIGYDAAGNPIKDMELWWYIKFATDDLLWVITFFVMARIAYQYSFRLFLIASVFFLYHVLDSWLFWWDFKRSVWVQWGLMAALIITVLIIIFPVEKLRSKYKSMQ